MRREAFKQYYIDYAELKKLIKAVSKNPESEGDFFNELDKQVQKSSQFLELNLINDIEKQLAKNDEYIND